MEWNGITQAKMASIVDLSILHNILCNRKFGITYEMERFEWNGTI
jgi:hypothetical protein